MPKQTDHTALAVIQNDVAYIKQEVHDVKILVQEQYVTKAEFEPIRKIVYGMVSMILVAVVGALISFVVLKP
jgi:formate-dependent nitrite reductase cytochrome c552 subunit